MNAPRAPSAALVEVDANDVVKTAKNPRKNRLLIQLPGLLGPLGAGPVGTLRDLQSDAPTLELETRDGRQITLKGRLVSSQKDFMTLQAKGETLAVRDVFDRLVVFDPPDAVPAASGDAPALDAPPDFEFGMSAAARSGGSGAVRKSRGGRKSPAPDEDVAPAGPRAPSGRARKAVSYAVEDDDEDEEDAGDDGLEFDLTEPSPAKAPPKKPAARRKRAAGSSESIVDLASSGDEAPPKKPKQRAVDDEDESDDDEDADAPPPPPRASSGRAKKKEVVYSVDDDDEEEEFDDGGGDDDSDF